MRVDLADGRVRRLTGGFKRERSPRFLPSGRIACAWSEGKRHGIDAIDADGEEPRAAHGGRGLLPHDRTLAGRPLLRRHAHLGRRLPAPGRASRGAAGAGAPPRRFRARAWPASRRRGATRTTPPTGGVDATGARYDPTGGSSDGRLPRVRSRRRDGRVRRRQGRDHQLPRVRGGARGRGALALCSWTSPRRTRRTGPSDDAWRSGREAGRARAHPAGDGLGGRGLLGRGGQRLPRGGRPPRARARGRSRSPPTRSRSPRSSASWPSRWRAASASPTA